MLLVGTEDRYLRWLIPILRTYIIEAKRLSLFNFLKDVDTATGDHQM